MDGVDGDEDAIILYPLHRSRFLNPVYSVYSVYSVYLERREIMLDTVDAALGEIEQAVTSLREIERRADALVVEDPTAVVLVRGDDVD